MTKTSEYLQRHRLLTWKQLCGTHTVNARVNHWKVTIETIQLVLTIGPVSHCLQGCNCAQRSADWSGRSDRCADCRSALHSAAVRGRATLNSTVGYTSIGLAGQASCMNVYGGPFLPTFPDLPIPSPPDHSTLPWTIPLSSEPLHSPPDHSTLLQNTPLSAKFAPRNVSAIFVI